MTPNAQHQDALKRLAGETAANLIESGMVVGLGTGSTAIHAIRRLAHRFKTGDLTDIVGIPTSENIENEAERLGLPLTKFTQHPVIDVTIDGADEVDPAGNLIKGGGGALLREKIVALASKRVIIIVDESKLSVQLGEKRAVPIEVVPFGSEVQKQYLKSLGGQPTLRLNADGGASFTDNGNIIIDYKTGPIADPPTLATTLKARTGIVEHGLFIGIATDLFVATATGVEQRVLRTP